MTTSVDPDLGAVTPAGGAFYRLELDGSCGTVRTDRVGALRWEQSGGAPEFPAFAWRRTGELRA